MPAARIPGIVGLLGSAGGIGPTVAVTPPASSQIVVTVVAKSSIPQFFAATFDGFLADSSQLYGLNRVAGLAVKTIGTGFSGDVVIAGDITNPAWNWPAGAIIFLNGTSLSTAAPLSGFIQKIGVAKTSSTISVELGAAVLL